MRLEGLYNGCLTDSITLMTETSLIKLNKKEIFLMRVIYWEGLSNDEGPTPSFYRSRLRNLESFRSNSV